MTVINNILVDNRKGSMISCRPIALNFLSRHKFLFGSEVELEDNIIVISLSVSASSTV